MKFLRSFNKSFEDTVDYYGAIDKKLALRFIDAVDRAEREIVKFPRIGKAVKSYRALLLKGFPFSFCYCESSDGQLLGLLLFHHKQREPQI